MNWNEYQLGELIHVKHGFAFKSQYFASEGTEIVLTPGNFYEEGGFKLRGDRDRFYSGSYPKEYLLAKKQIIIAMTEQGEGLLGSAALIPENNRYLHNQRLGLVTVKDAMKIDPFYLYKLFNTQEMRLQIFASATGAKVRHTAPERIYKCKVLLPSLPTQKKIAGVLSAYDDLIEANLKRIKLLEEMAQITYEEWFVRLRFPNHKTTPTNPETGLPEGWYRKSVSQLISVNPRTKPDVGVMSPYVPMSSLSESLMLIQNIESRIPSGGTKFKNGDTLFARITPCLENGKTGFVQFMDNDEQVATGSTEYIVLRETGLANRYFIYCLARSEYFREFSIKSMVGSDGRQRVNPDIYDTLEISVPDKFNMDRFRNFCAPVFKSIDLLVRQNIRLKEARDLLLPRLMTGLIDIDDYLSRNASAAAAA